jgi:crotonobetainyl-CoA:carnitine CoA-transferase CaiB-like acyl-CoA transferase
MPPALLTGLRVLAVEQYGAGPFGTQWLSDLGAEVIKIENPADGGDVARGNGPHYGEDLPKTADSYFYQSFNRNKRSITLNLADARGREIFNRLVKTADAVASNLRGDVPERIGITYKTLGAVNPRIVCAHLTGYGRDNERANWPGYDYLMQAEAGYFDLTGDPEGPPSRMGLSLIDLMTGTVLAFMIVSGVVNARETGKGRDLDVSLFDLAVYNLGYVGHWRLNAGATTTRLPRSAHPSMTPCQAYKTRDGWIFLMCNKEKFWPLLCGLIGHPEWSEDERFLRFPDRLKNRALVTECLDSALQKRTTQEWIDLFGGAIPCSPILDVAQALENPFVTGRGSIESLQTEGGGVLKLLSSPIRGDGEATPSRRGPTLGEDTSALLREIGITADEEATLRKENVL